MAIIRLINSFLIIFLIVGAGALSMGQISGNGIIEFLIGTTPTPVSATNPLPVSSSGGPSISPYLYTPLSPEQHNLAITSSTGLTIPSGALFATVCASGNNVNYTFDGTTTPTASVGNPLLQGQCMFLSGPAVLTNFLAIQKAATATLDVAYSK